LKKIEHAFFLEFVFVFFLVLVMC